MKPFELKCTLFGADIAAQVTVLDKGIHVLLAGGYRSHVGAVALAQGGELLTCPSFPGHKEQVIAERWARVLSRETESCATVACGIHHDNATTEQPMHFFLSIMGGIHYLSFQYLLMSNSLHSVLLPRRPNTFLPFARRMEGRIPFQDGSLSG